MKKTTLSASLLVALLAVVMQLNGVACGDPKPSEPATEAKSEASAEQPQEQGDAGPADDQPTEKPVEPAAEPTTEPSPDASEPTSEPTTDASEPTAEVTDGGEVTPELPSETTGDATRGKTKVAIVANSDFVAGSFSLMSVAGRKKLYEFKQIMTAGDISGDILLRHFGQYLFVLNRFNDAQKNDRIDVFDLAAMKLLNQVSLDPKANPHDVIAVNQKRLFVTQYGKSEVVVFEENKTPVTIDLSSLAEASAKACTKDDDCTKFGEGSKKCDTSAGTCQSDGLPEMSRMILHGSKIYVLIQGLDRNDGFKPVKSAIAVIDTTTDKLVKTLPLKGSNPTGFIAEPSGTYLVVQANSSIDITDGGLERFDPAKETLSGSFILTEQDAGGSFSFSGGVVASATVGYLIVNDAAFKQSLIQFNPTTGKVTKTLLKEKKLSDIALHSNGELYVGDKGDDMGKGRGVRVFEATTGNELTSQPVDVSDALPPSHFVFAEVDLSLLPQP